MEAKHKLIAMQEDLGLGHKGEIIITTQGRVDGNLPAVAQDVDSEYAEKICHNFNAYDSDQKKIKALLAACEALAFDLNSTKLSGPVCWCDPNNSSNLCTTNCRNMQAAIALEGGEG